MFDNSAVTVAKIHLEKLAPGVATILESAVDAGLTRDEEGVVRKGCWVCVYSVIGGDEAIFKAKIGDVTKGSRSIDFCEEKVRRIHRDGLVSSYENRDEKKDWYGGGIRVFRDSMPNGLYYSISHLPEPMDECILLLGCRIREMGVFRKEEQRILDISGNSALYERLRQACPHLYIPA